MVTPLVGVWIEIVIGVVGSAKVLTSLPSWECGLKYSKSVIGLVLSESLPSWECGLKSHGTYVLGLDGQSLPSWECGLKSTHHSPRIYRLKSLPSWECGLKSYLERYLCIASISHSPRGSVD